MIIIRYLILLTLVFLKSYAWGQLTITPTSNSIPLQPKCSTEPTQEYMDYLDKTRYIREELKNNNFRLPNQTLQVAVHIIVKNEANLLDEFSESQATESIEQLNTAFSQVGFSFECCSDINYISEDIDYSDMNISNLDFEKADRIAFENNIDNVINIYFADSLLSGFSCGWATNPAVVDTNYIIIQTADEFYDGYISCAFNGSLAHEMGHYFNLLHTFERRKRLPEFVNGSNCGYGVGDELCDTPADPKGLPTGIIKPSGNERLYELAPCTSAYDANPPCTLDTTKIQFGCNITDSNGDTYLPNPKNIMTYVNGPWQKCQTYFSPQQIERMRVALIVDRIELLSNSCEECIAFKTFSTSHLHDENTFEIQSVSEDIMSRATVKGENLSPNAVAAYTIYNAGESVCLYPSFEAEYGSTFLAYIEGCEPSENLRRGGVTKTNSILTNFKVYPNPFSRYAEIQFDLVNDSQLAISLFNVLGKQVKTLVSNKNFNSGKNKIPIDGSQLPSGIYYCSIQAGNQTETQKLVITK